MRDSSVFVRTRKAGDCGDSPINAVWYQGTTTAVPVLELGNIVFRGGTSLSKALGIGVNGKAYNDGEYKIPFDSILKGGSGVKIRACGTALKKTVRFKCCDNQSSGDLERMAIDVRAVSNCEFPKWFPWVSPKEVWHECSITQTCCQKLEKLAAEFNADPDSPVVATVSNVGTDYFLYLESKIAGLDFVVISQEGLTEADQTIPNFYPNFSAKSMEGWFGDKVLLGGDLTRCMTVVEIFHYLDKPYRGAAGTSNPQTDPSKYHRVLTQTTLVFDDAVANSLAAKNALITLLNGTSQYNDVLDGSTAADFPIYEYCVTRTDAGDAAALTDARADYATGILTPIERLRYVGGKSYYTIKSSSGTVPTPDGTDVVVRGACGADDYPCTDPSNCPEPDSSLCVNC